ncbi:hypothetical protein HII28_12385 [Planctomonas sp. JC2975]|uniref:hypothetical protein n=1 Tax=Planctomonas sp. JC2975 TaxID=2729626 RepID=UPI0014734B3E|nr:hypothetical protein [Planctomonas sp. JC2975]NNC12672.1 hypothetical protein [Planctomonas sp. JC2975]
MAALIGALLCAPALLAGIAPASAHDGSGDGDHLVPVVITSPADGSTVPGPVSTIAGQGGPATALVVFVDWRPWCATPTAGRSWSCSGSAITAPGLHHVEVFRRADDDHRDGGNEGDDNDWWNHDGGRLGFSTFTIATPPPAPLAPGIRSIANVSGGVMRVAASAAASGITISGTAVYDPHYAASVAVSGAGSCSAGVAANGTFSCTLPGTGPGSYPVTVRETIAGACASAGFTLSVRDDTPAPTPEKPDVLSVTGAHAGVESISASSEATGLVVSGSAVYDPHYPATVTVALTDAGTGCTASVAPNGTFSCTLPPAAVGVHTLTVTETIAGVSDTESVSLTVSDDSAHPAGLLTFGSWSLTVTDRFGAALGSRTVAPGGTIIVNGYGVAASASITIELHSTPVVLARLQSGSAGTFRQTSIVPADTPAGDHTVVVRLSAPGYADDERDFPLTVTSPAAAVAPIAPAETAKQVAAAPPSEPSPSASPQADAPKTYEVHNTAKHDPGERTILSQLPTLSQIQLGPPQAAAAGGIVVGLIFLIALPAVLLEATLRENYERIFRFAEPVRRVMRPLGTRITGHRSGFWAWVALYTVIVGFILSFADPNAGIDAVGLRLVLALVTAQVVHDLVLVLITSRLARSSLRVTVTPVLRPGGILFVVGGVILTRALGLEPGVLFGAWLVLMALSSTGRERGHLALTRCIVLLTVGVAAWIWYSILSAPYETYWQLLGTESLSAVMVGAMSELVVVMLPMHFLEGHEIWEWSKKAWFAIYAVVAVIFAVVVLPQPESWIDLTGPAIALGAVFGSFGVLCIGVWAYFRFTTSKDAMEREEERDVAG